MDTVPSTLTPSRTQLFRGFFKTGLTGFGGVLPHVRRMLVEDCRWLTDQEFIDLLGLGQMLPGPNVCNIAVVIGARFHGWPGALIALGGLMAAPFIIILSLATVYARFAHTATLSQALVGVGAAAAGLMLATGAKMAARAHLSAVTILFMTATFVAIAVLRLPLLWVLGSIAPLSVALAWLRIRKQDREQGAQT